MVRFSASSSPHPDFFEPLARGSLITPGFGGRVYFPTGKGFIAMQVMPKGRPAARK